MKLVAWVVFVCLLVPITRYLFGARIYLTCALRQAQARQVSRRQIDPGELRVLSVMDAGLTAAGFTHIGFVAMTPILTHYAGVLVSSVFVNERIPAYAYVRRSAAPEYGRLVEVAISTEMADGSEINTVNTPYSIGFLPPRMRVGGGAGLSVAQLVALHAQRVAGNNTRPVRDAGVGASGVEPLSLEHASRRLISNLDEVRKLFRQRRYVEPTSNTVLDRFTFRGAFCLAHYSRRVFGRIGRVAAARGQQDDLTQQMDRTLRVEADLAAVLHVAEHPKPAPGMSWPLIALISGTALLSLIAMTVLWDIYIAALILAVIALHEAGHAVAMRAFGYRDVHVFFVPLLGAVTVGRPSVTGVRDRLTVLLAGPVPGLWLSVALLVVNGTFGPSLPLRVAALALLLLNGMNLLPFTPLDGGRVLEGLSRPESPWRLMIHGVSVIGLIALAIGVHDPVIWGLAAFWAVLFPRFLAAYRLRRAVANVVRDRADYREVVRAALDVMAEPRYHAWRAPVRQMAARTVARQFAQSLVSSADRRWGVLAYLSAWIPLIAAAMLFWES